MTLKRIGLQVVVGLTAAVHGIAVAEDSPATYSYSRDPKAVVLYVATTSVRIDLTYSMMVFGDGRVEVDRRTSGAHERYEFQLEAGELQQLLDTAVSSGLAEYDDTRIYAEQKRSTGQIETSIEDGEYVEVTLSLTRFERGEWSIKDLRKTIKCVSPGIALRRYPTIREFEGLNALARFAQEAYFRPESNRG